MDVRGKLIDAFLNGAALGLILFTASYIIAHDDEIKELSSQLDEISSQLEECEDEVEELSSRLEKPELKK